MTVTFGMNFNGDLDNPKHREVVAKMEQAISDVLDSSGLSWKNMTPTREIIQQSSYQNFVLKGRDEKQDTLGGKMHSISISGGFHGDWPKTKGENEGVR